MAKLSEKISSSEQVVCLNSQAIETKEFRETQKKL